LNGGPLTRFRIRRVAIWRRSRNGAHVPCDLLLMTPGAHVRATNLSCNIVNGGPRTLASTDLDLPFDGACPDLLDNLLEHIFITPAPSHVAAQPAVSRRNELIPKPFPLVWPRVHGTSTDVAPLGSSIIGPRPCCSVGDDARSRARISQGADPGPWPTRGRCK